MDTPVAPTIATTAVSGEKGADEPADAPTAKPLAENPPAQAGYTNGAHDQQADTDTQKDQEDEKGSTSVLEDSTSAPTTSDPLDENVSSGAAPLLVRCTFSWMVTVLLALVHPGIRE